MKKVHFMLMGWLLLRMAIQPGEAQTTVTYTADNTTIFANPERGFHLNHFGRGQSGNYSSLKDKTSLIQQARSNGVSILRLGYVLEGMQDTDVLDPQLINQLRSDFNAARSAGFKVIPLFCYTAPEDEFAWTDAKRCVVYRDAPKDRILTHLDQLAPVLRENSDVIAFMYAGFISYWGEWNAATCHNLLNPVWNAEVNDNTRAIVSKLLEVLPPNRMIALRYPRMKIQLYGNQPLTQQEAFSGTAKARVGAHNDCFLANNDVGNYNNETAEKDYLSADNLYLPQGGETCGNGTSTQLGCANALENFRKLRFSEINLAYHQETIQGWKGSGCYEEIARRLGYRYQLVSGTFPGQVTPGSPLSVNLTLKNEGWAGLYNPRHVEVVLRSSSTTRRIRYQPPADERLWLPGPSETKTLTLNVPIPSDLPAGSYEVLLNLPDPMASLNTRPEYAIRLANQDTWEAATGYNKLNHTLTVTTAAAQVVAYQHGDFQGAAQSFGVGTYQASQLNIVGNDQISSLRVAAGLQVTVAQHNQAGGLVRVYQAGEVSYVGDALNDQISYLRVEAAPTTQRIEAELGTLKDVSVSSSGTGYSGTGYVNGGSLDGDGDGVTVSFSVPTAGTYPVTIGYNTQPFGSEKYQELLLNNGLARSVRFPLSTSWSTVTENVSLTQGTNTLTLRKGWGWMHVDYFEIGTRSSARLASQETAVEQAVRVYPNPASEQVTLELVAKQAQAVKVTLTSLQGQRLRENSKPLQQGVNRVSFTVKHLPKGFYLLHTTLDGERITQKLLIE